MTYNIAILNRWTSRKVFVLTLMCDGPNFWRKKMGAVNEKTQTIKERKRKKGERKKRNNISSITLFCYLKILLSFH